MIDHDDGDGTAAEEGKKYRDYINVLRLISPVVLGTSYETRLCPGKSLRSVKIRVNYTG